LAEAEIGTDPFDTPTDPPTVVDAPEQVDPAKYSYVTVPPALKAFDNFAESDTEPPTIIVEAERLVEMEGDALPTEIEIATECDNEPLVPLTITVYVPLAEDPQDMAEVPEPTTLIGERVQESPVDGDTVAVRLTSPTNPLTPANVKVEFPAAPTVTVTVAGLAAIVKS